MGSNFWPTRTFLAAAGVWFAAGTIAAADVLTFHANPMRTGWLDRADAPAIADVTNPAFGELWQSPEFDWFADRPPRLYATPLYLDRVEINSGTHPSGRYGVIFAATSNGFVYAVNAFATSDVPAGAILWRSSLARVTERTFDGLNLGVMSTPVIDPSRGVIYVSCCASADAWQIFALDVSTGRTLPGWPVTIDDAALAVPGINRNAPGDPVPRATKRALFAVQRGALNLSPDGRHLYVGFGEATTGWLVSIDTGERPRLSSAFATVRNPHRSSGGIWGAAGAAVDERGNAFIIAGTNFGALKPQPHDWNQSVLQLGNAAGALELRGTYTPFNHGDTATHDIDLGSGGPCLIPSLNPEETATPHLMAFGGKQGNVYLLDRSKLPGDLTSRPPVGGDSSTDQSLLAPSPQPQFGRRGPLNVFGPYTETKAAMDMARSRSVPAYLRTRDGRHFLFVTGQTKVREGVDEAQAPCLARLRIVTAPGAPAYLEIDQSEPNIVLGNPGSPLVTSRGGQEAIVWVLDENASRTALLVGESAPRPVLYAFDALSLKLLFRTPDGALHTSGKYNEPLVVHNTVFVGTDRIQAFGVRRGGDPAPSTPTLPRIASTPKAAAPTVPPGKELYAAGGACAVCHGTRGEGLAGVNPPLAGSEWVNGPEDRLIKLMLHGLQGPITVAGKKYDGAMMPGFGRLANSPFNWDDEKIAAVLTYIRTEWGNTGGPVSTESVTRIREKIGDRPPWTEAELLGRP